MEEAEEKKEGLWGINHDVMECICNMYAPKGLFGIWKKIQRTVSEFFK